MKLLIFSILMLALTACICAEAQPEPSYDAEQTNSAEGRFIFKTVSVTLQTLTITSTTTSVTTCTTSTAALSVCTASGRRRRGLHLSGNKEGRGLFYNEKEEQGEDNNVFLPQPKEENQLVSSQVEPHREGKSAPSEPIPFEVQPGYDVPSSQGRVYLAFGTSTITTTSTITSTASLTAICVSTTGYQVCGSQGKK